MQDFLGDCSSHVSKEIRLVELDINFMVPHRSPACLLSHTTYATTRHILVFPRNSGNIQNSIFAHSYQYQKHFPEHEPRQRIPIDLKKRKPKSSHAGICATIFTDRGPQQAPHMYRHLLHPTKRTATSHFSSSKQQPVFDEALAVRAAVARAHRRAPARLKLCRRRLQRKGGGRRGRVAKGNTRKHATTQAHDHI